jgi:hypothetical protein
MMRLSVVRPSVLAATRRIRVAAVARQATRLFSLALLGTAAAVAPGGAAAFTFKDGTTLHCIARGEPVEEYNAPPGHPLILRNHIAITEPNGSGYRIVWNAAKLGSLPPDMHDFIFFHECAHASVPTRDEFVANCVGLMAMRGAGRAGFAVETRLAAFYGRNSSYWQKTLECANANREAPVPLAPR